MDAPELLRELVELESPTGDEHRIEALGRRLARELERLGFRVERRGLHLLARLDGRAGGEAPLLLLAHMDTVWPAGTLETMPFRVEDGVARGPGAFDMKAGVVMGLAALEQLRPAGGPRRPVVFAVTVDEEVGSPTGRRVVEEAAAAAAAALVLEPPVRDGTITTERFGLARYQLHVRGRAAHAGHAGSGGVSAIEELAHQTLRLHALADHGRGIRVNVGQVGGGTGDNVVAGEAWARIDARSRSADGQRRLESAITGLQPALEGTALSVGGGVTRPPMVRSAATAELAGRAIAVAARLGTPLREHRSGGGSDGNFTAAAGVPTLDGLGPAGGGAHSADERVSLASLEERTRLLAALLEEL